MAEHDVSQLLADAASDFAPQDRQTAQPYRNNDRSMATVDNFGDANSGDNFDDDDDLSVLTDDSEYSVESETNFYRRERRNSTSLNIKQSVDETSPLMQINALTNDQGQNATACKRERTKKHGRSHSYSFGVGDNNAQGLPQRAGNMRSNDNKSGRSNNKTIAVSLPSAHQVNSDAEVEEMFQMDVGDTFWLMKRRRWDRLRQGTVNRPRTFSWSATFFSLALFLSYLGVQIFAYKRFQEDYFLEFEVMGFLSLTLIVLLPRLSWFGRIATVEVYMYCWLFFVLGLSQLADGERLIRSAEMMAADLALILCTYILFRTYPHLVKCWMLATHTVHALVTLLDAEEVEGSNAMQQQQQQSWDVSRSEQSLRVEIWQGESTSGTSVNETRTHYNAASLPRGIRAADACVFQGTVRRGKPHGLGTWIDPSPQGELLRGWWEDGVPIGPFESMENGTRSMLVNLRLFYCSNAGGRSWLERTSSPRFGVASVECVVSGNYFKGFPHVTHLHGPHVCDCYTFDRTSTAGRPATNDRGGPSSRRYCTCVSDMLRGGYYRHIDEDKNVMSVVVSVAAHGGRPRLTVSGHRPNAEATGGKRPRSVTIDIDYHDSTSSPVSAEAGMTLSSLSVAETNTQGVTPRPVQGALASPHHPANHSARLALDERWMTTGSSPTEALLFIHGFDHNVEDVLKRFGQLLALGRFPAHIRPFVFAWPGSKNPLLYWCASNVASDTNNHRDLRHFLASLRNSGIRTLHIMCHSLGVRFFLRSFSSIKGIFAPALAEESPANETPSAAKRRLRGLKLANLMCINPDYDVDTFLGDYGELRRFCNNITIYTDPRDEAVRLSFTMTKRPSLGHRNAALYDAQGRLLDVDLIDMSDLDRNTTSAFHSFFNVNRLMVDDLYDIVVHGRRAEERYTRLRRWGDVYRFTILPESVNMV